MVRLSRRGVLITALASAATWRHARAEDGPVIAAAADLKFALSEVADVYTRETGRPLRLSFGASGNLARQIMQGGPFEMFLSADESFVRLLADRGLTLGDGDLYAIGRVAIFVRRGSPVRPDAALDDLAAAVSDGRLRRLAIANPDHAPYGRAAREALVKKGIWEAVQPKLVLGENVAQAAQFAMTGAAEAGLIAHSLALTPTLVEVGDHAILAADLHTPLKQRMVLLRRARDTARHFYDFVQRPAARAILARHGFTLPPAGD